MLLSDYFVILSRSGKTLSYLEKVSTMRRFLQRLSAFLTRTDGPTAVEYAVMLALIVVVCIAAIQSLGSNSHLTYDNVTESLGGHHDH